LPKCRGARVLFISGGLSELRGNPGRRECPFQFWSADCPLPRGPMNEASRSAEIVKRKYWEPRAAWGRVPVQAFPSGLTPNAPPEFGGLSINLLGTCHAVQCGASLVFDRDRHCAASRLVTAWRSGFLFTGVSCTFQDPARASELNLRARRPLQSALNHFRHSLLGCGQLRIGYTRSTQCRDMPQPARDSIGKEDLQNGKTKHTT